MHIVQNICECYWFLLYDYLDVNCADTYRPKFVDKLKLKCVDSSCKKCI